MCGGRPMQRKTITLGGVMIFASVRSRSPTGRATGQSPSPWAAFMRLTNVPPQLLRVSPLTRKQEPPECLICSLAVTRRHPKLRRPGGRAGAKRNEINTKLWLVTKKLRPIRRREML